MPSQGVTPSEFLEDVCCWWKQSDWATVWWKNYDDMLSRFHLVLESNGRTDRRTDRWTDGQTDLLYQYRASVCWRVIIKSWKFHRKMQFRLKISICQSHMVHKGCCMNFPDKGWKLGSINGLLNRSHTTGTIVRQPGSCRLHSACSDGRPRARTGMV